MRRMTPFSDWSAQLPPTSPLLAECITVSGSLTNYLMATGHDFAVSVLQQGSDAIHADETALFELTPDSQLHARHVCLTLAGKPVVVARSVCLPECPVWRPILERGSRSLGLTLFGDLPQLRRGTLDFAELHAGHPLFALAQAHDPYASSRYLARRCLFELDGQRLLVCEIFLPELEQLL